VAQQQDERRSRERVLALGLDAEVEDLRRALEERARPPRLERVVAGEPALAPAPAAPQAREPAGGRAEQPRDLAVQEEGEEEQAAQRRGPAAPARVDEQAERDPERSGEDREQTQEEVGRDRDQPAGERRERRIALGLRRRCGRRGDAQRPSTS
jgi:hypothetical protein